LRAPKNILMPELVQKQVAYAILKWLKKQGSDEELDVAVQCVSQHFEVELGNAEDKNLCDTGLDLEEAVRAIVAKSGDSDAVKEQKLQEFIGILKQKGYFQGVEEGSPGVRWIRTRGSLRVSSSR